VARSVATELRDLRQQVEKLQIEVAGRQSIGVMVVWDGQNESSVNQENFPNAGTFNGLVVHLTNEPSPLEGTPGATSAGISEDAYVALKARLLRELPR
jgi:hypothetical protein